MYDISMARKISQQAKLSRSEINRFVSDLDSMLLNIYAEIAIIVNEPIFMDRFLPVAAENCLGAGQKNRRIEGHRQNIIRTGIQTLQHDIPLFQWRNDDDRRVGNLPNSLADDQTIIVC